MKPKLFIASSVEGLDVAYSVQTNLHHDADVTVWSQGVFIPSSTSLESLSNVLEASDYGIFVFSPDDELIMRGSENKTVRDNVIFELGMFIGRLGKQRCFIISPDNLEIHFPTDLIGMSPVMYSGERDKSEIAAALGPACHEIRKVIQINGKYIAGPGKSKIPANEYDGYDEEDKLALLESWLNTSLLADTAVKYTDVDAELKLEPGTCKRLMPIVIEKSGGLALDRNGANFFRYSYYTPDY